jgi:hypothetical protein
MQILITVRHYPAKLIIYERLSPYFAFRPHDVIQQTLRQTTQLAKSTVHYPMRRHLKSRFQMLRHERLNEVVASDNVDLFLTCYPKLS